ncbi:MAG: hypothetical protein ACMUIP_11210 [bacterium]
MSGIQFAYLLMNSILIINNYYLFAFMEYKFKPGDTFQTTDEKHIKEEIERTNAKLRHFRGVACSVLNDAAEVWQQIWADCQDPRTCEEILDNSVNEPNDRIPTCGWPDFREKLYLLGKYIEYTRRLLKGSIDKPLKDEREE